MLHSYNTQKRDELLDQSITNIKAAMDIVRDCERMFNPDPDYSSFNDYNELSKFLDHAQDALQQEYLFLKDMIDMYKEHIYFILDENTPKPPATHKPDPTVLNNLFE